MGELTRDLVEQGYELRETHISQVFLGATTVYKIKKPVTLSFLDFSSLAQRRACCEAEVELNRRLAPAVYRGVVPITRDADGTHRLNGSGETVEYAVEMRRLPEEDAADARLADGRLGPPELQRLAQRLARFHAEARCDAETTRFGELDAIETNVRENFEQTRQSALAFLRAEELAAIERYQLGFLRDQAARFAARRAQGRIRDGHGDLRLEHCYIDPSERIAIIDCIEFNDRFRYADVCADLAFLSMDLTWHERTDLAETLLAEYARASGDYDLYGLVDFYASYRAFVRGKVSALLADDARAPEAARAHAREQTRKYFLLAAACAREPLETPVLYAVGGLIASGKSTVARELGALRSAPVLENDLTRKQLLQVEPTAPLHDSAFTGHYSPEANQRVYAELLRRADVVLGSRRTVVLDASFREAGQRAAALALARRHGAGFRFIECSVPEVVARERLALRAQAPSVSDGRDELVAAFAARYEPVRELPPELHLTLDTSRPLPETLAALRRAL